MTNHFQVSDDAPIEQADSRSASPTTTQEALRSTPFKEWRESAFKLFREIKSYWKDRRAIINDRRSLVTAGKLNSKPFTFALNGLVLPGVVVGLLYSVASSIYSFPAPQIDRAIDEQKNVWKILDDALRNDVLKVSESEPAWAQGLKTEDMVSESKRNTERLNELNTKSKTAAGLSVEDRAELDRLRSRTLELVPTMVNRTMRDLQVSTIAAQKEAARNQLNLLRVKKFAEVLNSWQAAIVGVTLLVAAYVFGCLIRWMKPPPVFSAQAVNAYLYSIGAVLLVPNILAAIINVGLDLANRYDVNWAFKLYPFLLFALAAWTISIVWRAGATLFDALDDQKTDVKRERKVIRRLFASQIIAAVVVQVAVTAAAIPVFWAIWRLQK